MHASDYPHQYRVRVAFRDLDALGHVNNAVYLSFLESARIDYLMTLLQIEAIAELPLILAEVTITYQSPAVFGEELVVGTGVARLGRKSFDVVHRIETAAGRLVVTAKTVVVVYDYESQTTAPIPAAVRQRITDFQGDWRIPDA